MERSKGKSKKKYEKLIWGVYFAICMIIFIRIVQDMGNLYGQYNERQIEVMAGLLAEKVNASIEHIVDSAEQAALWMSVQENQTKKDLYQEMQSYVETSVFADMGMFSSAEDFYGSTAVWRDMNKYHYIDRALEAQETYLTEPYRSCVTATHMITVMVPIQRQEGKKDIMYASFPLETIQALAQTEALDYQPEIALLNAASGNYIACTGGEMAAAGSWNNLMLMRAQMHFEDDTSYSKYIQSLQKRESSGIARFSLQGREYIQGFVEIESMPDWYIAVNLPSRILSDSFVRYQTRIAGYIAIFISVTVCMGIWIIGRQLLQKKKLQQLSEVDPLLGILNKRAFLVGFQDYVNEQKETAEGVLIFVDVDNFKIYNDRFGHLAGDMVLKNFADTLTELFGENGLVGRYGGDEFILFLKGARGKSEVEKCLQCARNQFHEMEISGQGRINVSFSAGIARFPEDGNSYEELCSNADKALYHVKEQGKDAFAWYR